MAGAPKANPLPVAEWAQNAEPMQFALVTSDGSVVGHGQYFEGQGGYKVPHVDDETVAKYGLGQSILDMSLGELSGKLGTTVIAAKESEFHGQSSHNARTKQGDFPEKGSEEKTETPEPKGNGLKLSDEEIEDLISKGLRRWQRGDKDRLYVNVKDLIECTYYDSGNLSSASIDGERISNSKGKKYLGSKTYIDLKDGKLHTTEEFIADLARKKYGLTQEDA